MLTTILNQEEPLGRLIISRLALLIPILIGISLLSFIVINILPGDVAVAMLGIEGAGADEAALNQIRANLGLDRPLYVQYLSWLWGVIRGDFWKIPGVKGRYFAGNITPSTGNPGIGPSFGHVWPGFWYPLRNSGSRLGRGWDWISRGVVSVGIGIPNFFIATLLLLFIAPLVPWIPIFSYVPFTQDPVKNLLSMLFPAISIGVGLAMTMAENARSAVLEILRQDYITVASAKGLSQKFVIWRHVLKNASIPLISILGLQMAFLFSGTIIIETIFSLPGLGKLAITGINLRDFPLVQGCAALYGRGGCHYKSYHGCPLLFCRSPYPL